MTLNNVPIVGLNYPKLRSQPIVILGLPPACWALFANLANAGEPPLAPEPLNVLLFDAYAVQHPGIPSPQAIQSVAVHLLTLYGVLRRGVAPAMYFGFGNGRCQWLTPPSFNGCLTVADILGTDTAVTRASLVQDTDNL